MKSGDVEQKATETRKTNRENCKSNFRIKFRRSELSFNSDCRKRNKMVRFVEAKRRSWVPSVAEKPKRNCAKSVDEKLKLDDAVLFLKTVLDESPQPVERSRVESTESEDGKLTSESSFFVLLFLLSMALINY